MKIELLQYLVTTAQCTSITEAADRLFLHQTTLSSAIKNIEQTTGVEIFQRSKNGITLTDSGKELVSLAQDIVTKWEQIQSLSHKSSEYTESSLLTATVIADQYSLLLLNLYRKVAPQGNLSIFTESHNNFFSQMLTQKYKLGIGLTSASGIDQIKTWVSKNGFVFLPLKTHYTYLYVNHDSPFANREWVYFHELSGERFVFSEDGFSAYRTPAHIQLCRNPLVLANIHLVRRAIEQENMIAFYLSASNESDDWLCKSTSIKRIKVLNQPESCTKQSYLVHQSIPHLSEIDQHFIKLILNAF